MLKVLIIESDRRWKHYAREGLKGHDYQVVFFDSIRHVLTNLSDLAKLGFKIVVVGSSVEDRSGNTLGPELASAIRLTYLDRIKIVQWSVNRGAWADVSANKSGNQAALGNAIRRARERLSYSK
jgi:DNA-binding NtrC family response regulator